MCCHLCCRVNSTTQLAPPHFSIMSMYNIGLYLIGLGYITFIIDFFIYIDQLNRPALTNINAFGRYNFIQIIYLISYIKVNLGF